MMQQWSSKGCCRISLQCTAWVVRQVVPLAHERQQAVQSDVGAYEQEEQEPIILHVRYTGEEYLGLIKDINRRSFIRTIPFSGGLACVLGVIGWLIGGPLDGLMMFILSVAVSVGIMLMNRRRAKHMIGRIEPADMQVRSA